MRSGACWVSCFSHFRQPDSGLPPEFMSDWDIIIIARDKWGDVRRRRHFLALEWAKKRKVLYVEPQVSPRKEKPASPVRAVAPNIFAFTPVKIVPNSVPKFRYINYARDASGIRRAAAKLGFGDTVAWVTAEYGVHYLDGLPHRLSVYDVTDDWPEMSSLSSRERNQILGDDRKLLRRADFVFTVSTLLLRKKQRHRKDALHIPNGVCMEMYENLSKERPREIADVPGKIVGYAGSLHADRLDVKMICDIADNMKSSNVSFVFAGPDCLTPEARSHMDARENIFILPPVPFDRLPAVIENFDICWIPHQVTPFTNSLDPLKAYEYLAAGRPMISSEVEGMLPLSKYVVFCQTHRDFKFAIEDILAGREKLGPDLRRTMARECSWAHRAEHIDSIIGEKLNRKF